MHEFTLIANLFKKIDSLARERSAEKIVGVKIRLGALAHISADHFREHFVEGAKGTRADGARLDIAVSTDETDAHAQDIMLESIEVV